MDAIVLTAVLNIYQTWSKYHGFKYKYKKKTLMDAGVLTAVLNLSSLVKQQ